MGVEYSHMGSLDFEIVLIDPCLQTATVMATAQTAPSDYYYEQPSQPSLVWSVAPPYTTDYDCPIAYSCLVTASPAGVDICSILVGASSATFDSTGGVYTLTTHDMATYPPGEYTLQIRGSVGSNSDSASIVVTLVDPCPSTLLQIV